MSNFNLAIPVILRHEGGWVNDPNDLGGETNFGISSLIIQRENISAAELGVRPFTFVTAGDRVTVSPEGTLKAMNIEGAKRAYQKLFWDRYKYGDIVDQAAATKIFDSAVNMGPYWGHLCSQKAANALGGKLEEDGKFGSMTKMAINNCVPAEWLKAMAIEMAQHYNNICVRRPRNKKFLKNWLKRASWVG